jgi:putative ABC transport system substrate-binding protein
VLAGTLTCIVPSLAQEASRKPFRVAVVSPNSPDTGPRGQAQFWNRLQELGYVDRLTLIAERYYASGDRARLEALMNEVARSKPDVLVTWTTPATVIASKATSTVPIVAVTMNEPVALGLAASLTRPGGNITGITLAYTEGLAGKWLQMLADVVPRLRTVAVIYHPASQSNTILLRNATAAAPSLGLKLKPIEVTRADQLERAAQDARKAAQGVLVLPDPFTGTHRQAIVQQMAKHRLPAVYGIVEFVDAGGLMGYGVDHVRLFNRAAEYVDKILKGTSAAELPIEQPTGYLTVVNLKAAKALGIAIPEPLLLSADEVIR